MIKIWCALGGKPPVMHEFPAVPRRGDFVDLPGTGLCEVSAVTWSVVTKLITMTLDPSVRKEKRPDVGGAWDT